ncbi:MAG: cyclic nucleotide-binding protein [Flavobacterium psychrophilum]|nr:MAG: cyclic nucleotide-binding protein [Flavobacterium psychrophilum]
MTQLEQYINLNFTVTGEEVSKIASLFQPDTLRKGDFYIKNGEACDKLSFVQSGFLRLYATSGDKDITQWIFSKGYFIGDMPSLTFNVPSRWNIQALTDIELFTIQKSDYNKIVDTVPRWLEIEKHFLIRCFSIMEDRIFAHLSMSAEERYAFFYKHNKELFNEVPLQYIASLLGMTSETFSRVRKRLHAIASD